MNVGRDGVGNEIPASPRERPAGTQTRHRRDRRRTARPAFEPRTDRAAACRCRPASARARKTHACRCRRAAASSAPDPETDARAGTRPKSIITGMLAMRSRFDAALDRPPVRTALVRDFDADDGVAIRNSPSRPRPSHPCPQRSAPAPRLSFRSRRCSGMPAPEYERGQSQSS